MTLEADDIRQSRVFGAADNGADARTQGETQ